MDNSSNMAVNTTPTANQINPEHHYGLDKTKPASTIHVRQTQRISDVIFLRLTKLCDTIRAHRLLHTPI